MGVVRGVVNIFARTQNPSNTARNIPLARRRFGFFQAVTMSEWSLSEVVDTGEHWRRLENTAGLQGSTEERLNSISPQWDNGVVTLLICMQPKAN